MTSLETLPPEILSKILSYLPYKHAATMRMVSRSMNNACGAFLTHSFQRINKKVITRCQTLKMSMPRRYSMRKTHPRFNDLLTLEMLEGRLGTLHQTMDRFLEDNECHFFAAEVLDETYTVLKSVDDGTADLPYRVTEEFYDVSAMALDFFRTEIAPHLLEIRSMHVFEEFWAPCDDEQSAVAEELPPLQDHEVMIAMSMTLKRMSKKLLDSNKKLKKTADAIGNHKKQLGTLGTRLKKTEKKSAECAVKLAEAMQEIENLKTAMQASLPNHECCPTELNILDKHENTT